MAMARDATNILHCNKTVPQQKIIRPKMSMMLRLRNSGSSEHLAMLVLFTRHLLIQVKVWETPICRGYL